MSSNYPITKKKDVSFQWEKDLNPEQRKAVVSTEGPLLVLAGAGTGKTRVIAYRIAYLIASGIVPADKILSLTFTNKAAGEMKDRVMKLIHSPDSNLWMGTFHSIFARILRIEASKLGYTNSYTIYDAADQLSAIKDVIRTKKIHVGEMTPKAILNSISQFKSKLILPSKLETSIEDYYKKDLILPVYTSYNKYLQANNAMDFDDLLVNTYLLFKNNPDVLSRYRKRFKYLLVDEFQDTNFAQYQIILQLAGEHQNICVVGDDDQSIYRWRGAEIKNILQFEGDFDNTKTIRLERNYRSTKNILKAANSIIENNKIRHGKALWSDKEDGEKITVKSNYSDRDEAAFIAESIRSRVLRDKWSWSDIAVLYRINSLSRLIEDSLRKESIPYTIVGGVKFYDRKEVKDVLAYLSVLVNPDDSISLKRIINYPQRGLGKKTIERLEVYADEQGISVFKSLKHVKKINGITAKRAEVLKNFSEMLIKYRNSRNKISNVELVSALTEEIMIYQQLQSESVGDSNDRVENVKELIRAIEEHSEQSPNATLESFLSEVALVSDVDMWDDSQQRVSLMTVHSAKGLEYPIVFLAGLEEGIFPLASAIDDPEVMEEERRLMYVASTRAMDILFMTHSRTRWKFDTIIENIPSRFLKEINKETILAEDYKPAFTFDSTEKKGYSSKKRFFEPVETEDNDTYLAGMRVIHSDFGTGIIKSIEGRGNKAKLQILFEGSIMKKLLAQYASLTILE